MPPVDVDLRDFAGSIKRDEPPQESARIDPRKLVWAYRVVNGANYDLKVGTLDLSQANKCWSSELLTNPGFETGTATGWTNQQDITF